MENKNGVVTFHHDNPDIPTLLYVRLYGVVIDINSERGFVEFVNKLDELELGQHTARRGGNVD